MLVWSVIIILLFLALLVAMQVWCRGEPRRVTESASVERENLKRRLANEAVEHLAQPSAIFDCMVEGLVLLDERRWVQLANRAFKKLFETTDVVQGKNGLEDLRLHELAEMVDSLGPSQPWQDRELKFPGPPERWLQVTATIVLTGATSGRGPYWFFTI